MNKSNKQKREKMEKLTTNQKNSISKTIHEFDAKIYLKQSKFDAMTEGQKAKAVKFLSDFLAWNNKKLEEI